MKNLLVLASGLAVSALGAGTASAGGSEGSLGVGAEFTNGAVGGLGGVGALGIRLGGMSANYDLGQFHLGGFLGFADDGGDDDSTVLIGGRFYYHLHSTAMSDFSIGGGLGMGFFGDGNPNSDNPQVMLLEPGVQIRAFIASNVALSFSAGLTIGLNDADGVAITGQPNGAAGFHYYFF